MNLSFQEPWFLLLFLLMPLIYYIYFKKQSSRFIYLLVRIILFSLIILALSQPVVNLPTEKQSILFLTDLSDSISSQQKQKAGEFIQKTIKAKNPEDKIGLISFGERAYLEYPLKEKIDFTGFKTLINSNFTSIESALNLGMTKLSTRGNNRMVLISDGEENQGEARSLLSQLEDNNLPVDVYSLENNNIKEVLIDELIIPSQKNKGEKFNIKIRIKSFNQTEGNLRLYLQDSLLLEESIELEAGVNIFEYSHRLEESGFYRLRAEIDVNADNVRENNKAGGFINIAGGYKVLVLGENNPGLKRIQDTFNNRGVNLDIKENINIDFSSQLYSYEAVILNNIPANYFSRQQLLELKSYVEDSGGSLIVAGGEDSFGPGNYQNSVLNEILPVSSEIETRILTHTLSMVLVIDKSGSMKGDKIEIARKSAEEVLDLLLSQEKIGIVAFDTESEWIIPLQENKNKNKLKEEISQFESQGGGTDILSGLETAFRSLKEDNSSLRHIILLSDGVSTSGNFEDLANSINQEGITLSTIAIGENADHELMSRLAEWGQGKSYFTRNINSLPRILTNETKRMIPSQVIEKNIQPVSVAGSSLFSDFNWDEVPVLQGFVRTTPKDLSKVHLKTQDNSPLFATWRYGLGQTAVFTSSLGNKWAQEWVDWPDYDKFWREIINQSVNINTDKKFIVRNEIKGDKVKLFVNVLDTNNEFINFLDVRAEINTPVENKKNINLEQTGIGKYTGEFNIDENGVYMINLKTGSGNNTSVYTTGIEVPYSPEYKFSLGENNVLENISKNTGGKRLESPQQLFTERKITFSESENIWNYLIWIALFLFIIDIAFRLLSIVIFKNLWEAWSQIWINLKKKLKSFHE